MPSAVEMFRAQRKAAEDIQVRMQEVADLLRAVTLELRALSRDEAFRALLQQEQTWLTRASDLVSRVERFRETESTRFWPAVWRRWAVAIVLTLVSGAAAGAGYVWAARPYADELAGLRARVELEHAILRRVVEMTPAERAQFNALMKWREIPEH